MNIHTVPTNDLVEHDTTSLDGCVCGPDVEFMPGGACVVHHSLDGRECPECGHEMSLGWDVELATAKEIPMRYCLKCHFKALFKELS